MADVITRFKLETTQYDSKLRDAAKGLQNVSKQAEIAGKDFDKFTKESVAAAQAFGKVESGANNVKDRLKDMVEAYNDVTKAYNRLTEQQRQTDFAKAMAQSLETLQDRIKETKQELYSLSDSGKGGGLFGEGGLTGMLQVAGGNLLSKGVSMLTDELTGAITQSINLAKQGEGIRIAFERLGKPGLIDNLKEATHGTVSELELMKQAIKFENFKLPLEDLATYLAFAQQKAKDTGESIDYLVTSIVNGLGRQSKQILDNLGISAAELTKRMGEGKDMTQAVAEIIREEMAKAGDYVETAADRAARAAAKATDKMEEMGRTAMPVAEQWAETWSTLKTGGMEFLNFVLTPIANMLNKLKEFQMSSEDFFEAKVLPNIMTQVGSNVDANGNYIKRPAQRGAVGFDWESGTWMPGYSGAIYNGATGQTELPEIFATGTTRKTKKTKGGRSSKTNIPSIDDFNKALGKSLTGSVDLKEVKAALSPYEMMLPEIKKNILDIKDADLGGSLAKIGDKKVAKEIEDMNKALQQQQAAFQMAAQAASAFGSALSGIDDPATKAAGTVVQAIASIALGFATASANANTAGTGWGWLAWLAAGASAMATTIATIHSLTGYAQGGIVEGNSYSGDNMMFGGDGLYGLNAGELVLTKAAQGNLASQLSGGAQNLQLDGVISGENIHIVHNRYLKRTGQGELVTWG